MKTIPLTIVAASACLFAACENPADKTINATVSETVDVAPAVAPANGVKYTFTPDSEILFTGSKVTGSHSGGFKSFTGGFTVAGNTLVGTGQKITIDMNSLWSDNEKLTEHLKSSDFFDVAKYPEATFELTGLKNVAERNFKVSGNLTLNGTRKNITFPASAQVTGNTAKIHAKFDINRKDFGIVYAGKADDLIRDEVVIELKLNTAPDA